MNENVCNEIDSHKIDFINIVDRPTGPKYSQNELKQERLLNMMKVILSTINSRMDKLEHKLSDLNVVDIRGYFN